MCMGVRSCARETLKGKRLSVCVCMRRTRGRTGSTTEAATGAVDASAVGSGGGGAVAAATAVVEPSSALGGAAAASSPSWHGGAATGAAVCGGCPVLTVVVGPLLSSIGSDRVMILR